MADYSETLEKALAIGKERHPDAPSQHHAAFANSVAYAVFRASGGYGGPSMREHWASRVVASATGGQPCSFEQAIDLLDECCYGPLTVQHAYMLDCEYCFDDAPGEVEQARKLLAAS